MSNGEVERPPADQDSGRLGFIISATAAGLIVGGVSLAIALYQVWEGDKSQRDLYEVLAAGELSAERRLRSLLSEIRLGNALEEVRPALTRIEYDYEHLGQLGPDAKGDKDTRDWAKSALTDYEGIPFELFVIKRAMMGETPLGPPLVKAFVDTVTSASLSQSPYQAAVDFFRMMLGIQTKGLVVLANAYSLLHEERDVSECLKPYEGWFSEQLEFNSQWLRPLDPWWHFKDLGPLIDVSERREGTRYVDTTQNIAAEGNVVTGLQLYKKGNRIGLKIRQAPLLPTGDVDSRSGRWTETRFNPSPTQYFDLWEHKLANSSATTLPAGQVVTGAQLYWKDNKSLAIKLLGTDLTLATNEFEEGHWAELAPTGQWTPNRGANTLDLDQNPYVNGNGVRPRPDSYITGARFYLLDQTKTDLNPKYHNDYEGRLSIAVMNRYFTVPEPT